MPKRITIIGGGITGLAAAFRLQRDARARGLPLAITLYEADARLGGKLRTVREGECVVEAGPDSFLASKPQALALCAELGLGDRLIGTNAAQRRTFIYSRGRLHDLPEGFSGLVPGRIGPLMRSALVSPLGKARLLLDLVLPARPSGGDEPVAAFMRRRLGREAFDRLIEPLMSGIYAGDAERLSLAATFPQLRQMELEHGGLLRGVMGQKTKSLTSSRKESARKDARGHGKSGASDTALSDRPRWTGFVSLQGGMGELIDALEQQLAIVVRTGCAVESIARGKRGWLVRAAGETLEADAVLLTTPAYATAALLEPLDARLAMVHRAIPYGSTATVSLAFRQAAPQSGGAGSPRSPMRAAGSDEAQRDTLGAAGRDAQRSHTVAPAGSDAPGVHTTAGAGRDSTLSDTSDARGNAIGAPAGFGFVVPSIERRPLLACTFMSNKFAGRAPAGIALIRCFIGRVGTEALLAQDDAALVALARSELQAILGIIAEPLWAKVFRWERAMPQYNLGHLARVEQIESLLAAQPGLFAAGAAYRGVGIPDCIRSADEAAAQAMRFLFEE